MHACMVRYVTLPLSQEDPDAMDTQAAGEGEPNGTQAAPRLCERSQNAANARRREQTDSATGARPCEQDGDGVASQSFDLPQDEEASEDEGATPREDNQHDSFPHLGWWGDCLWDDILPCPAVATAMVLTGAQHELAEYTARLCVLLGDAKVEGDERKEKYQWKVPLASDAFLFCLGGDADGATRSAQLSRRLADAEEGNWGSLLVAACEEGDRTTRSSNDKERAVARVAGLFQAGEISRAAAAVWGGTL
jgi:hypothetical protein